jgi:hypothetical protein
MPSKPWTQPSPPPPQSCPTITLPRTRGQALSSKSAPVQLAGGSAAATTGQGLRSDSCMPLSRGPSSGLILPSLSQSTGVFQRM